MHDYGPSQMILPRKQKPRLLTMDKTVCRKILDYHTASQNKGFQNQTKCSAVKTWDIKWREDSITVILTIYNSYRPSFAETENYKCCWRGGLSWQEFTVNIISRSVYAPCFPLNYWLMAKEWYCNIWMTSWRIPDHVLVGIQEKNAIENYLQSKCLLPKHSRAWAALGQSFL